MLPDDDHYFPGAEDLLDLDDCDAYLARERKDLCADRPQEPGDSLRGENASHVKTAS